LPPSKGSDRRRAAAKFAGGALVAVLALGSDRALAHPHVYVDVGADLEFDAENRLQAIRLTWAFDELYSVFAIEGMDADGNGIYDAAELTALTDINLTSIADYGFFTELTQGGERIPFDAPEDGTSVYEDGRLTLSFTLPLAEPTSAPFALRVYDPEYYIDFDYLEEAPVTVAGSDICKVVVSRPDDRSVYGNLPESFFTSPEVALIGARFASTASISCEAGG